MILMSSTITVSALSFRDCRYLDSVNSTIGTNATTGFLAGMTWFPGGYTVDVAGRHLVPLNQPFSRIELAWGSGGSASARVFNSNPDDPRNSE